MFMVIMSNQRSSCSKALVIDVAQLSKTASDAALVAGLAGQTGYWPVFSFLNSVNNLIDLASVGVIGQKGEFLEIGRLTATNISSQPD